MDPILVSAVIAALLKVAEMSENWNNDNYQPPSAAELRSLAKQLEELPDLPTKFIK